MLETTPDSEKSTTIGVVTVTYNSAAVLPAFFESLKCQTHMTFRLFVIDNNSKDASVELLSAWNDPRLTVIANADNRGVAEGNNQGIRAALATGCETVLLLNNDTVFGNDLFATLLAGLYEQHADMVCPKIMYYDKPTQIWAAGGGFDRKRFFNTFHRGLDQHDSGQFDTVEMVNYAPTCCILCRRSVFDSIGLMDQLYFVYSDDVDFLYRCLKRGLNTFYLPIAVIYHKVSSLTGGDQSSFSVRHMTRNRMYFLRKHRPTWEVLAWAVHFFAYTAPVRVLDRRDSLRTFLLRCTSVFEGWVMTIEAPRSNL